jgi:N4-gp56 family major capsid protein
MAVDNFIPEVWRAALLASLKKALVYAAPGVANRNYEGDIARAGDTVRITSVGRPTIGTYVPNVTTISPETLTTGQRTLTVDQSKYFAFEIDDVDARQVAGTLMGEAMTEAAYALRDVADRYVGGLYTQAQSANQLGTIVVDASTPLVAYDSILVPLKVKLDEASVPTEGRYCIVPPWLHGRLLRDNRFIDASASGSTDPLLNGRVGRAAGFDIYVSNNCPNPTADHNVVTAGHPMAVTYAEQIANTEAYRPESSFSDAVKGLHVYGAKVIRPEALATAVADPTT